MPRTKARQQIDTIVIGGGQAWPLCRVSPRQARPALRESSIADARIGDHWRGAMGHAPGLYSPARLRLASRHALPGARSFHWPTGREDGPTYLEGVPREKVRPAGPKRDAGSIAVRADRRRLRRVDPRNGERPCLRAQVHRSRPGRSGKPNVPRRSPPSSIPVDPAAALTPLPESGPSSAEVRSSSVGLSHSGADIAFRKPPTRATGRFLSGKSHGGVCRCGSPRGRRAVVGWPIVEFMFAHVFTMRTPIGRKMRPDLRKGGGPLIRVRLGDLATRPASSATTRKDGRGNGTVARCSPMARFSTWRT